MARISAKVAMMEAGMATQAITVPRQSCRKKKTVRATSTAPSKRWKLTSSSDRRMKID